MKSLISSKTFQVSALTFLVGVLTLVNTSFASLLSPEISGIILTILGVLNAVLRYNTSTPIGGIVSVDPVFSSEK